MAKLLRLLWGYVTVVFQKGFGESFLSECYIQGVNVSHIKATDDGIVLDCTLKDYKRLCKIAQKHGGRIKILKRKGLVFPFAKIMNRSGLIVGAVLGIAIFGILSGYVWNVDVTGYETLEKEKIIDFLSEQGLHNGVSWRSVDKRTVESLVMARFDEVAWVHINRMGTSALVELREADLKTDAPDTSKPSNVVAKKDGLIVYTLAYDGWQQVKKGDSVTKGDLLVSGVYESEHAKENMFAHADGVFLAQTVNDFSLTVSREQKYKSYLDTKQYKAISFFGLYLPLYIGKIPKSNADINKICDYIMINSRPVPVGLITVTAQRYKTQSRILNDNELTELINNEIENQINSSYGKDNVTEKDISVELLEDRANASGTVSAVENIAEVKEFVSDESE